MYEFWYGYLKPKFGDRITLYYMDTDSLIPFIKTEDFYEDIAVDRPLLTGKNKKAIALMKVKLGGRIMKEFRALRPKTYVYQTDDDNEVKKAKGTKKCVIKKELKFNDYKNCLLNIEIVFKSQQRFKSERHDVYTEEVNKIALSSNGDKRLQTFDKFTTYPCGASVGKVCKAELLSKVNIK